MKIKTIYYSKKSRSIILQLFFAIIVFSFILYLGVNIHTNLSSRNIQTGFSFLYEEAGFEISESIIAYSAEDTYLKALFVGLLNTFKVIIVGNILALFLGLIIAMFTLMNNILLKFIARSYIEVLRNIPLLLQLLFWYSLITQYLPRVKNAISFTQHIFISNRGLNFSSFDFYNLVINKPKFIGFNFEGGLSIGPEFFALLLGLVLYTSAFMAEIFRAGILSINKSQWEAAYSLGLTKLQTFKTIILPQSLKVVIPPMIGQLLNLAKNSSLAVAIGYPDFVSVANTSMNQTGQAIELILLIMIVYLIISLNISLFINIYNARNKRAFEK